MWKRGDRAGESLGSRTDIISDISYMAVFTANVLLLLKWQDRGLDFFRSLIFTVPTLINGKTFYLSN